MIQQEYPDFQRLDDAKNDTSKAWKVPGFKVKYTKDCFETKVTRFWAFFCHMYVHLSQI